MTLRQRKLIGTFACAGFLAIYCLIAMAVGANYVIGSGGVVEFLFFVIAGIAWLPALMLMVRWMSARPGE